MKADYTFLPWARQGLANRITAPDPNPAAQTRAEIEVKLALAAHGVDGSDTSHEIARKVQLYGPGDVIGLDARAVVRTDPRHWITNYEPNYLAAIEFFREELPGATHVGDFSLNIGAGAPGSPPHRVRASNAGMHRPCAKSFQDSRSESR